jgi:RNA polymerase sigma-70 factor, ECF subfamily
MADPVLNSRHCNSEDRDEPGDGESALIVRLQQGEVAALGQLYETHRARVYRTALGITRDERAAEDVLQECFIRLYTYAGSVDPERPLRPWLYRVTVNLCYDWASRRPAKALDDVLEWISGLSSAVPAPDHRTEEQETVQVVREVVAQLPPTHRAVLVLFYMENLSLEEIAQVLDLPVGTVKSRLHYARRRLREMLTRRLGPVPEMQYEFT